MGIVDEARALVVATLRDAAGQFAPGNGSYEHLANMASKVERAEAVAVDSYLVLDCVIAVLAKGASGPVRRATCARLSDTETAPPNRLHEKMKAGQPYSGRLEWTDRPTPPDL